MSLATGRIYVYCIVPVSHQDDPAGVLDGTEAIADGLLRVIRCGEMAAIASDLGPAEGRALQQLGEDAAQAREWVLAHHRTLDRLTQRHTVLPLRFGTVFGNEADIGAALEARRDAIGRMFDHLAGAREWGLKIFCDRNTVRQRLAEASTVLGDLRRQIAMAGEGKAFFLTRRLERLAEEEIDRAVQHHLGVTWQRLAAGVRDLTTSRLQPQEVHGRNMAMVANHACLVAREAEDAFVDLVEDLRSAFGPFGFVYETNGPWPAYSFVEERLGDGADAA